MDKEHSLSVNNRIINNEIFVNGGSLMLDGGWINNRPSVYGYRRGASVDRRWNLRPELELCVQFFRADWQSDSAVSEVDYIKGRRATWIRKIH